MLPAIYGSATLTMVVSSTSMNAARVTTTAISQRLRRWLPAHGRALPWRRSLELDRRRTDRPNGSGRLGSRPLSITIFTGTR